MHEGRLAVRRYKTRARWRRRGAILLLAASVFLAAEGILSRQGEFSLIPDSLTATQPPVDATPDTRTVTLAAHTWYALQLGVFENEESARALARQYAARGAAGYVLSDERHRVLAAAYDTREDAAAVQERFHTAHGIEAYIFEIDQDALALKLSGKRGQLDAVENAVRFLNDAPGTLLSLSRSLDAQKVEQAQAAAALADLSATAGATADRLDACFEEGMHEAVAALSGMLRALSQNGAQTEEADAVQLGARVKYCLLDLAARMSAYAGELTKS